MTFLRLLWLLATFLFETATDEDDTDDKPDEPDDEPNDDEAGHKDEEIKDPLRKITALEEQRARLIKKLDKKDRLIRDLEAKRPESDTLDELRRENAFLRTAIASGHHTIDLDTAWTLLTTKGFADALSIDDGEVSGMEDALEKVIARYPWLVDTEFPDDVEPSKPSGRPMHSRKSGGKVPDNAALAGRFPALRGKVPIDR